MNTFEWLPTETAPKNYPVYLFKGYFKTGEETYTRIPDKRTVYYGWGEIGSIHITAEDFKAVPEQMSLIWLAYTENQYYKAEIELPSKKIDSLFQLELKDPKTGKINHFNYISVGLAPGGMVAVWMIADAYQIEIGTYQASKTEIDFKDMIPTTHLSEQEFIDFILSEEVEPEVLEQIKAGNIPYNRWKDYRKTYNWKIALSHKEQFVPGNARIAMLNGEQDVQYFDQDIKPLLEAWAIPSYTRIEWQDKNGNLFAATINFDEVEITEAFTEIFKNSAENAKVNIAIDAYNVIKEISLMGPESEIPLTKTQVKVYSKSN